MRIAVIVFVVLFLVGFWIVNRARDPVAAHIGLLLTAVDLLYGIGLVLYFVVKG